MALDILPNIITENVLGLLKHPGIAHIHEAGAADTDLSGGAGESTPKRKHRGNQLKPKKLYNI